MNQALLLIDNLFSTLHTGMPLNTHMTQQSSQQIYAQGPTDLRLRWEAT